MKNPLEEKWIGDKLFQKVRGHLLGLYKQIKLDFVTVPFVIRKLISA